MKPNYEIDVEVTISEFGPQGPNLGWSTTVFGTKYGLPLKGEDKSMFIVMALDAVDEATKKAIEAEKNDAKIVSAIGALIHACRNAKDFLDHPDQTNYRAWHIIEEIDVALEKAK